MKIRTHLGALVGAALIVAATGAARNALASPLTLTWTVRQAPSGLYRYSFALTLDNHDGSWQPGQGFGWIVFADGGTVPSRLDDFARDAYCSPVGPWDDLTKTAGRNNGPTLAFGRQLWRPAVLGDALHWTGTSSVLVSPDEILWTSLATDGGATRTVLEPAIGLTPCGPADVNGDGFIDPVDFGIFNAAFEAGTAPADINYDGFVDGWDFDLFVQSFETGC